MLIIISVTTLSRNRRARVRRGNRYQILMDEEITPGVESTAFREPKQPSSMVLVHILQGCRFGSIYLF